MASRRSYGSTPVAVASGNVTVSLGTEGVNWVAGDLCVVMISYKGTAQFSAPAGWDTVWQDATGSNTTSSPPGCQGAMAVFSRELQASDSNPTFTRSGGDSAIATRVTYQPDAAGTVSVYTDSGWVGTSDTTTITINSVTPSGTGDLLVCGIAQPDNNTCGAVSGTTPSVSEFFDQNTGSGSDSGLAISDGTFSSGSASGARSATGESNAYNKSIAMVITEAAGATPVSGSGTFAVPVAVIAGTGTQTQSGTGSVAVDVPTLAATGTQTQAGTGSMAVAPTLAGTGTETTRLATMSDSFPWTEGDVRSGVTLTITLTGDTWLPA